MFGNSHVKVPQQPSAPNGYSRRSKSPSRRVGIPHIQLDIVDDEDNAMPFDCFDLSPVGVYLHSDYLLLQGDRVTIRLRLDFQHRPIEVEGEVVRVETGEDGLAPGMGIAFREMGRRDSNKLKQFLFRRFLCNG